MCGERRLAIKSRLNRDVDQQHAGLAHRLFGVVNCDAQSAVRGHFVQIRGRINGYIEQRSPTVPGRLFTPLDLVASYR